jgi:hypothetical protein
MKVSGKKKDLVDRLVDPFPCTKDVFTELKMARKVSVELLLSYASYASILGDKSSWSAKIELAFEIFQVFESCSVDGLALSPEGLKLWENLIVFTSEWKRKCQTKTTVLKWNSGFGASLVPEVVVVDLPETNAVGINAAIAAFAAVPILAAVPAKDNPSANPFVWPFANFDEANHWISFLKGRINGIRCLQYTTTGPGALY